jgi:tagaturonate reductase
MEHLNQRTLKSSKPDYPVKILQFGTGNFLRGFVDWMVQLMNERIDYRSSVHIIQSHGKSIPEAFNQQDCLYHVLIRGKADGQPIEKYHLISCIKGISNPHIDFKEYLSLAMLPDVKIVVSNTTEAGIAFRNNDGGISQPAGLFPGNLTSLLYQRFLHFKGAEDKGLWMIPCELIRNNGDQLKECVLAYAAEWKLPKKFIDWINNANIFCNTLVDRIVPGFPEEDSEEIFQKIGLKDQLLVTAEPYHFLAVVCNKNIAEVFPAFRAGLEVHQVNDLEIYRRRKVSILNGAHTAMVPIAYLQGFRTVHEVVEDQQMGNWIRKLLDEEVIPSLALPDGKAFASTVMERFANPFIRHELSAIALNSISKFRIRVLPSILTFHHLNGKWPTRLMQAFAALIIFYKGNLNGKPLPVNDEHEVTLVFKKAWALPDLDQTIHSILQEKLLWDKDLTLYSGLQDQLKQAIMNFQLEK